MGRRLVGFAMLGWTAACGNTASSGDASGGAGGARAANSGGVVDGPRAVTGGSSGGSLEGRCAGSAGSPGNLYGAELASNVGGQGSAPKCLPRKLSTGDDGRVPCSVVEVRSMPCACDATLGMQAAPPALSDAVWRLFTGSRAAGGSGSLADTCTDWCVCELAQLSGDALHACQTEPNVDSPPGYCYIDAEDNPASSTLLAACPALEKRALRFLEHTGPGGAEQARWFLMCAGSPLQP